MQGKETTANPYIKAIGLRTTACASTSTPRWTATLPGREHSKGARLQVLIADRLGMTVENAQDLVSMG